MPTPDGPQFIDLVHYGLKEEPPHTVKYGNLNDEEAYKAFATDRRHIPHVIFMAEQTNSRMVDSFSNREYAHRYRVPVHKLSTEVFGDDDYPERSLDIAYQESEQPELWAGIPARRGDAVNNNRVVRYRNAVEAKGTTSYIVPKSMITSGEAEYTGTVPASSMRSTDEKSN